MAAMLHIDFETRSAADLLKVGAYNYARHPTTDILCMGWAVGDGDVAIWRPGKPPPKALLRALEDGLLIAAWNAQFERLIWNNVLVRYGFPPLPLERFYCIAALSRARGYPGKLEKAAMFAGLPWQKDMEGHRLMMKLCRPRRVEEDGAIEWWDYAPDYDRLAQYCRQDVLVERAMFNQFIPFTDLELSDYHEAERINDRGVCVDLALAEAAVRGAEKEKLTSTDALIALTGGEVDSHMQIERILTWVEGEWKRLPNLNKSTVIDALLEDDIPPHVADVLEIRLEQARAAVSKFSAMRERSDSSGIVNGLFMFRGAGQTGRFSATGVQIHNVVRESAVHAIPVLLKRGISGLRMIGDPVHLLAQMVRPAFIAAPGKTYLIVDYAQIEARITAWLAGEESLLKIFRAGGDPYCAFGTVAYGHVITKADELERLASKQCVLGLGFGGAEGALARAMKSAANIVLPGEQLTHLVGTYRNTYTCIVKLWYVLRDAVLSAMYSRGTIVEVGPIAYLFDGEHLWCRLPSGRLMCYPFAKIVTDEWGDSVEYRRGNRSPKSGVTEWPTVRLWHGVLIENLAQGIAFDLLMGALRRLHDWAVRIHVHDEIVAEVDIDKAESLLPEMVEIMTEVPPWAVGLPIAAEGKISPRYVK